MKNKFIKNKYSLQTEIYTIQLPMSSIGSVNRFSFTLFLGSTIFFFENGKFLFEKMSNCRNVKFLKFKIFQMSSCRNAKFSKYSKKISKNFKLSKCKIIKILKCQFTQCQIFTMSKFQNFKISNHQILEI